MCCGINYVLFHPKTYTLFKITQFNVSKRRYTHKKVIITQTDVRDYSLGESNAGANARTTYPSEELRGLPLNKLR